MSGRLDQPLDSIINSKKKAQRDSRRRSKPGKTTAVIAPVGGIKKAKKPLKPAVKVSTGLPPRQPKFSKIVVSGLPIDVNEAQIKEYFQKAVGPIRKVSLSYDKDGRSRGVADIIFSKPESAKLAAETQNGVRVDGKPMRIEVVVDAKSVPEAAPAKSLTDRVTYAKQRPSKSEPLTKDSANPKAQPKSATVTKPADGKKGKAKPKKNTQRPKRKTAEELDAEMTDYFAGGNAANNATAEAATATNGTAATSGDDMGMEEIS